MNFTKGEAASVWPVTMASDLAREAAAVIAQKKKRKSVTGASTTKVKNCEVIHHRLFIR